MYASLPGNLTVAQNLRFFGLLYGVRALAKRIEALLREFALERLADTAAARDIRASIREQVRASHAGVLWTSHNMYEVEEVCDRVLFLSHGRILLAGDPRSLPHEHGVRNLEELFIRLAREPLAHREGHAA